jgi:hypothetical protein
MTESNEPQPAPTGTRLRLPCGHRWTMPWGLPPEAAMADLLHHQTVCDLDTHLPGGDPRLRGVGASASLGEAGP